MRSGRHPAAGRRTTPGIGAGVVALAAVLPGPGFALDQVAGQELTPPPPPFFRAMEFYTGTGGRVDDLQARQQLTIALETGHPVARMWLARIYSRGRMGEPADPDRARVLASEILPEIRRRAELGEVESIFLVGTAYDEGLGVAEDPVEAARWHRRAAELDHVLGAHVLGNQYAAGRGVPQDPGEAVRWWLPAGRAGDAVVQLRLGEAYEQGLGVETDLEEALRWYRDAAGRGNTAADEALARLGLDAGAAS
jgi:TPR repeat protein